jgi:hypothetical protein
VVGEDSTYQSDLGAWRLRSASVGNMESRIHRRAGDEGGEHDDKDPLVEGNYSQEINNDEDILNSVPSHQRILHVMKASGRGPRWSQNKALVMASLSCTRSYLRAASARRVRQVTASWLCRHGPLIAWVE